MIFNSQTPISKQGSSQDETNKNQEKISKLINKVIEDKLRNCVTLLEVLEDPTFVL
jgi:hypothetical protein